jgi:PAS domain S-box-containing protein
MKIRSKITLSFLVSFFLLVSVLGIIMTQRTTSVLREMSLNHLEIAAKSRAEHIRTLLTAYERRIGMLASGVGFKELLSSNPTDSNYQLNLERINFRINDPRDHPEFDELAVMDKDGIVITSTREEVVGIDKSGKEVFQNAKEGAFINDIHLSELGDITLSLSAPILSPEGNFLGVLAAKLDENTLFEILTDKTGLGETGETYLINQEGFFLTSSRILGEEVVLNKKVDMSNARNCFNISDHPAEHIGHRAVGVYENYAGETVFATHIYIKEMDWCLLSEISKAEATAPVRRQLIVHLTLSSMMLLVITLVAFFISQKISTPLEELRHGVEIIEKGALNHKVGTSAKDEIGQLSRAFDKMVSALKESRKSVDKKVEDQTEEIRKYSKDLQEQQEAILNVLDDVEKEKAEATIQRDRLDIILRSIGDGVFVVNKDLEVVIFNPAAEMISGFAADELRGKIVTQVLKFIDEKDGQLSDQFIAEAIEKGKQTSMANHTLLIKKDGTKVPVADSAAPLVDKNGNVTGCVVVFRDVSREREIDKMKTEFLSVAAHQLRTPLGSMRWNMEMLLNGDEGELGEKVKEVVEQIYESNIRMIGLVNDLLDVSRIDQGKTADDPKNTNVITIISEAVKEMEPEAKRRAVSIDFRNQDMEIEIIIDGKRFREVIQNILSNAVKYNKQGGKVAIAVEKNQQNLTITIADTGMGVSKKDQGKLFSKFFRAENAVRSETEGSGLGLFVVKSYVEGWGGKVDFESEEGKGSRVGIILPLKPKMKKKNVKSK